MKIRFPHRGPRTAGALALALALGACGSAPPIPDWQLTAKASADHAVEAALSGDARVEAREFDRARAETARTGRADQVARVELLRCAAQVATLRFEPVCAGFEPLRVDAGDAERAYAAYLIARPDPAQIALLPESQRVVASALLARAATSAAASTAPAAMDAGRLRAIADPLARLVAAAVALRGDVASPAVVDVAIDTASQQGWRRALLAWLEFKRLAAERRGDGETAGAVRRRIDLVTGSGAGAAR